MRNIIFIQLGFLDIIIRYFIFISAPNSFENKLTKRNKLKNLNFIVVWIIRTGDEKIKMT